MGSMSNIVTINQTQLAEQIRLCTAMDQPLFTWGPPGVGKTDMMMQLAEEMGARFCDVRLSQYESIDLRGLPDVEDKRTVWHVPSTLPFYGSKWDDGTDQPILLFLDEAMQAPPSVQGVAMQLVNEGRIGEHELLPNVRIFAASNRETDKAGTSRMLTPLANRFFHVQLEAELDPWVDWARSKGIHEALVSYVRFRQDNLNQFDEALKKNLKAYATPRMWAKVGSVLRMFTDEQGALHGLDKARITISAAVGEATAAECMSFLETWQAMPNIDNIIANPMNAPVPDKPDMRFAVQAALAARAGKDTAEPILAYVDRLPGEYRVSCVMDMMRRDQSILTVPAMRKWYQENNELVLGV